MQSGLENKNLKCPSHDTPRERRVSLSMSACGQGDRAAGVAIYGMRALLSKSYPQTDIISFISKNIAMIMQPLLEPWGRLPYSLKLLKLTQKATTTIEGRG
jgi:hypothetical protein